MKISISEIINGWSNVIIKDEEVEKKATERLEICNGCDQKKNQLGVDVCGMCHCPLIAKVRSMESKCPLGKWD